MNTVKNFKTERMSASPVETIKEPLKIKLFVGNGGSREVSPIRVKIRGPKSREGSPKDSPTSAVQSNQRSESKTESVQKKAQTVRVLDKHRKKSKPNRALQSTGSFDKDFTTDNISISQLSSPSPTSETPHEQIESHQSRMKKRHERIMQSILKKKLYRTNEGKQRRRKRKSANNSNTDTESGTSPISDRMDDEQE